MKNKILNILIFVLIIFCFAYIVASYENELKIKDDTLKLVNEARIRAENKPCCIKLQEQQIDKIITNGGMDSYYEQQGDIIYCGENK